MSDTLDIIERPVDDGACGWSDASVVSRPDAPSGIALPAFRSRPGRRAAVETTAAIAARNLAANQRP